MTSSASDICLSQYFWMKRDFTHLLLDRDDLLIMDNMVARRSGIVSRTQSPWSCEEGCTEREIFLLEEIARATILDPGTALRITHKGTLFIVYYPSNHVSQQSRYCFCYRAVGSWESSDCITDMEDFNAHVIVN